jgi:hypothetical protein
MPKPARRSFPSKATKRTVYMGGIALMALILSWGYATHLAIQATHLASP